MSPPDFANLPPEYQRLLQLAKDQHHLDVVPLAALSGGQTGAFLYLVSVSAGDARSVEHFVVKFDHANPKAKPGEIERHRLAHAHAPANFASQNMPQLAYEVEHEGAVALFYTLAGQSLQRFRTLASLQRQSRLETLFGATNDYLMREWNAESTVEQALHPQKLLARWLGYRLKPDGQIASFLQDVFHVGPDTEGFLIQGQIFPNPLSYGLNAGRWRETRPIDVLAGLQHGDLNTGNILAKFADEPESLEGYFLIDFALYKAQMPLLYDECYLEMSYLIRELNRAAFEKWVSLVIHYSSRDMPNPQGVPVELAGACAVINAGRKSFERWVYETHPSLADDLWGQRWLAAVAAGLNYCNKAALSTEARLAGLIFSAVHLKRYCAQFGVPFPIEVRLLYDASQRSESASTSKVVSALDLQRRNLPVQPTPSVDRQAEARPSTPSGTVTFLFTDIEGSTKLWEQYPEAMKTALARHDAILHEAVEAHHGHIVKSTGDGIHAAFEGAASGVAAALAAQQALFAEKWEVISPQAVRVRMGLHTSEAETRAGDYYGPALNRAARLMSIGHGGQTLLSATTADLARDQLPAGASLRDLGEHGLKDLARLEHVYQLIHPDLPADFPPLKSLHAFRHSLPVQVTSFIGRQAEMQAVKDLLLRENVRLLTLTGPGGIGKTRLALHVGAALADHFASGVCFVPLEPISDPALVVPAIAQALHLRDSGSQPLLDSLEDYLQPKNLLLLLDNFEQVTSAAPVVADLLAAPRLKVLVTSRALLQLRGEHEFVAPPLSLPDPTHLPPSDRLGQYEAVQLFVQRARAARADFALTDANATAVAEICHRLDGLPLAIELAAARVKLFPPETLLARLSSRLQLLTGGARDLPARQQTLRNTIDWSHQLLHKAEQTLFAYLGVFVGGCTMEAAEAVCNPDRNLDVLEGVASLINKSLLKHQETPDGQLRVGMLATIREYANERLLQSGDADDIQRQHANFFLGLAEAAARQVNTAEGRLWMDRLEMERGNLGAALNWCLAAPDRVDTLARLVAALYWFWYRRGHLSEGREWAERALALTTDGERTPLRGHALIVAAAMAMWQGDLEVARKRADEGLEIWRNLEEAPRLASALIGRGVISAFQGDYAAAHRFFEESLALGRELGDRALTADALMCLGAAAMGLGDYGTAGAQLEEAVREARQVKDEWIVANSLNNLGEVARCLGDYERARVYYEESGAMYRDMGDKSDHARSIHSLGYVAQHQGDPGRAVALFEESLSMHRELDNKRGIAECVLGLASVAAGQGRPERAARLLGASETILDAGRAGRWEADRVEYNRTLETARTMLGEAAFAAAWAEGQAMTLEQAVAYALEEAEMP